MPPSQTKLAIVIPAFKGKFLATALKSITKQTNQDFQVYVCDDGSPEDLRSICKNFLSPINGTYKRFEPNMGARRVVQHWNRSVACASEPWVWLFSDDDIMEPTCVEAFLHELELGEHTATSVYRFNTLTIDADDRVLFINPPHPQNESAVEFAYHRLANQRRSYAPEYVFRRNAWLQNGGFVDFPYAQGSDDASWITFAGDDGIRLVAGPHVQWRQSQANISGASADRLVEIIKSGVDLANWFQKRFDHESPLPASTPQAFSMRQLARGWMMQRLLCCPTPFSVKDFRTLPGLIEKQLGESSRTVLRVMLNVNFRLLLNRVKTFAKKRIKT